MQAYISKIQNEMIKNQHLNIVQNLKKHKLHHHILFLALINQSLIRLLASIIFIVEFYNNKFYPL